MSLQACLSLTINTMKAGACIIIPLLLAGHVHTRSYIAKNNHMAHDLLCLLATVRITSSSNCMHTGINY